jgi:hypothetical protein
MHLHGQRRHYRQRRRDFQRRQPLFPRRSRPSTLSANTSGGGGAALANANGTLSVIDSTVSGNQESGGDRFRRRLSPIDPGRDDPSHQQHVLGQFQRRQRRYASIWRTVPSI